MSKKFVILSLFACIAHVLAIAQISEKLSEKVTISINANIETYFLAEKLAVEHMGNYVFSSKDIQFSHQPIVYFGLKKFISWKNTPVILRIAEILKEMRDVQHDNAQQLEYLLYRNQFPKTGFRWPAPADLSMFDERRYPGAKALGIELADSLASFYRQAEVGVFLSKNARFYKGALAEAKKYINAKAIPYMEKWYGQQFAGYEFYLMPGMPITPGDDNYRAFGPMLISPKGKVATMVFSSSIQLPLLSSLKEYQKFGFDNEFVVRFLTVHEIGHSFVNPAIERMKPELLKDTALFTPALRKILELSYIESWESCVIEHLVRLGEIRVAKSMGDLAEVERLKKLHITEFGFKLLPLLEKKITEYENNRSLYPHFESFIPEIFKTFHELKPSDIDQIVNN